MEGIALADRLQEKVAGVCLVAGALLLVAGAFLEFADGMLFAAGLTGSLTFLCFLPGLTGIARSLRQHAPRLAVFGGLIATMGCVGGVTFETAMLHEWAERTAGTPEAMMLAITTVVKGRVFPVLVIFGIQFSISLIVLGFGLWRTGVAPKWVPMLLVSGAILFPFGHIGSIEIIMHLADLLLAAPLLWIGLHYLVSAPPPSVAVPAMA